MADCIPLISSGVAIYLRAVFTIDFTGEVAMSVATLAPCTTFGDTASAHRTKALPPLVERVHAPFTICGANRRAGSFIRAFCVPSIILDVAHRAPPSWYA